MITPPTFNVGDKLLAANLQMLSDAIIEIQGDINSLSGSGSAVSSATEEPITDPYTPVFVAEVTGAQQWKEKTLSGAAVVDFTDGRACTNDSDPSAILKLNELQGILVEVRDAGDMRYALIPNGIFPVDVVQNGGTAGDSTHYCSYTYDVYFRGKSGNATFKIGSTLTPNASLARILMATATAATKGQGYWSGQTFVLELVYEKLSQTNCA